MLIICPSCATSYDVDLANLSPNGRQVRCARCRTIWHAEPSHADKLLLAAAALAPGAGADDQPEAAEAEDRFADELASAALGSFQSSAVERPATAPAASFAEHGPGVELAEPDGYSGEVEAPPIVPVDLDESRPRGEHHGTSAPARKSDPEAAQDIESVAARRTRAQRASLRWPLSRLQTAILALALLDTILVGWRSDVVRALPQTASFYSLLGLPVNLRGLTFDNVATATEQHEGVPILVVEGNVINAPAGPKMYRASNSSCATRPGRKSIPGPRFPRGLRCRRAREWAFGPVWRRRQPRRAMSSFALSLAATSWLRAVDIPWHAYS